MRQCSIFLVLLLLLTLPCALFGDQAQQLPKELQGSWRQLSRVSNGEKKVDEPTILKFSGTNFDIVEGGKSVESGTMTVDLTKMPKKYLVTIAGDAGSTKKSYNGIYNVEDDILHTCVNTNAGEPAPTLFNSERGSNSQLILWRRVIQI